MKRALIWSGVGLGAVALAFATLGRPGGKRGASRFETAKVERGRITARVTASGTLSALVTVQVGSQVSGRIQELHVDFNSPVRRGQVLARIDRSLFEASVGQSRANLAAAEGNLAKARAQSIDADRQYERAVALSQTDQLIAQADVDTAKANADAAKAQIQAMQGEVEQARAALHQAEVNLGYTTIVSPIDGIVISRSVDVGQTVAASLQAPTLFTIAQDLRKMQVDSDVAEADVGKLRDGMPAAFTVDAYPSQTFRGRVRQVRNAPQTLQNVVTYDAVIDVDNPDLKLKPGMTANVTFVYASKDEVLKAPNSALRFRPPGEMAAARPGADAARGGRPPADPALDGRPTADRRTVWVLRGDRPAPVSIRVGISDGAVSEILEGELHEGDLLITDVAGEGGAGRPGGAPAAFRRGL
jgi:HlyD family secretion protein